MSYLRTQRRKRPRAESRSTKPMIIGAFGCASGEIGHVARMVQIYTAIRTLTRSAAITIVIAVNHIVFIFDQIMRLAMEFVRSMKHYLAETERLDQIRAFIDHEQRATVAQIAEHFNVSPATVRRAIGTLADRGEVSRFHGGALALQKSPRELPALQREADQREAKRHIGKAAADLVGDGETVFLGSGTTALEVARNLTDRRELTVLTNSLLVIQELLHAPDVAVIALGGLLRRSELSFIGHVIEQALQEMRATKVIMGIRAIHPEQGLMNDYLPETLTDRAILQMGGEVIVVADHTKCDRVAPVFLAPVSAMGTLVTDTAAPDAFVAALTAKNINVLRV